MAVANYLRIILQDLTVDDEVVKNMIKTAINGSKECSKVYILITIKSDKICLRRRDIDVQIVRMSQNPCFSAL